MSLAIGPIQKDEFETIKKLTIKSSVMDDLRLYVDAYNEQYGQTITVEELMPVIVEQFLKKDKAFQQFKKNKGA